MILFERDPAGNLRPKPWTAPHPPRPCQQVMFTWPYLAALTVAAVGIVLGVTGGAPAVVAAFLVASGLAYCAVYCAVQVRLWWHEMRWMHSPHGVRPLDDEGLW